MPVRLRVPGFNPSGVVPGPAHLIADDTLSVAGALAGAYLLDGADTLPVWSLAGPGVWEYTGTSIKPTTGGTTLAMFDTAGSGGGDGLSGIIRARLAVKATTNPFIGIVTRATDVSNYIRWVVQSTTGKYRLTSHIAGVTNTLYDSTTDATAGDVIGMEVAAGHVYLYVNGGLVQDVSAPSTLANAALQGTKWGVVGNFTTDPTSALDQVTFDLSA